MAPTTFSLFPCLPTELRLQIWREALPEKLGNPLYFYKKGCWGPRHLTEADEEYDPNNEENNLNFEFHHDRLDPLHVEVPLFFVNQEARSFALSWISEQGLKTRFDKEKQSLVFIRPFDPQRDTLYVSQEKWDEFHCEPFDRVFEADLENKNIGTPAPVFTRLAVSDELLLKEPDALEELFHWYYGFDEIFVILKVRSDGFWHDAKDIKPQQRWELETVDVQGPIFYWNLDSESFQWKDEDINISDYALYDVLQHASPKLSTKLLEIGKERFEVRPVTVVRK
ncbi:hypothetical protein BGW36DRAFT_430234 [Talaromyces proteolyticus]|uniref:2EXR domain-containing protein n=1 Tax=Talaromyces proteolyticus TaxID=1131652 RepID=A0AAD4KK80_9EURO|nr:uncharacterized protein BGW36DRAFT_430234 [Talaromyces proteolyticus]KAH8694215.1 hypothetical protein BGW36DRAFT_430234 [Talaromyces proteolyticus]